MNHKKTFLQFVIPSVMAFALSGVYTIVDGFFVGNSLGDNGLAAINLAYPIAAFIQAIGTGIGLAGAIRYAILKGQKQQQEEKECFTSTVFLLTAFSLFLTIAILGGISPLIHLFGAEGEIRELMRDYVRVIAFGATFQIFATGLVPFVRNLGGSSFAMFTMIAGFITNIILDYLFIWEYGQGMAGAAWATIVGQGVTVTLAAGYLIKKNIGFCFPAEKFLPYMTEILKVSLSPFGLTFSCQITTILMNRSLMLHSGEQAVAVYGCIAYIMAIVYLLLQGVGDGSQPLVSRYYGEGQLSTLKIMRKLAYVVSGVIAFACMTIVFLLRDHIGILFGASIETNQNVASYLPLFLVTVLCLAYVRITTSYLYATEKTSLSYLLVYAEPVIIAILLVFLPQIEFCEGFAIWISVPLAQFITWCISIYIKHYADNQIILQVANPAEPVNGK